VIPRFLTATLSRRLIFLMLLATVPPMFGGLVVPTRAAEDNLTIAAADKLAATTTALEQARDMRKYLASAPKIAGHGQTRNHHRRHRGRSVSMFREPLSNPAQGRIDDV
jgi:hypothetical protein